MFLVNDQGQSFYLDKARHVQTSTSPKPLPQSPEGWVEQQLSFTRNAKYFGFNRSYSPPIKFVEDGATILRYLYYTQQGIESPVFYIVSKLDPDSGVYEDYYKGELDLSKITDDVVRSVTVNVIEGGIVKLIKAYENTVFEIPCDGSIQENKSVRINGIKFKTEIEYNLIPFATTDTLAIMPMTISSQQGGDTGIIKADTKYQAINIGDLTSNENMLFSSVAAIAVEISGQINITAAIGSGRIFFGTNLGHFFDIVPLGAIAPGIVNFDITINLAAGENLFPLCQSNTSSFIGSTQIYLDYNSQMIDTYCQVVTPMDLFTLLWTKICEHASTPTNKIFYPIQSNLLKQFSHLSITSGASLRGLPGAVIKTTIGDFFTSFHALLCGAMGSFLTDSGEVLFFEAKKSVFNADIIDFDLGDVSELKIDPAEEYLFDTLKIGYAEQKYDDKSGIQEYNTVTQYRSPVKRISKELSIISKYRGDSYGIEFTRILLNTSNSTNNKSDNDCFILGVDFSKTDTTSVLINSTASPIKSSDGTLVNLSQVQYSTVTGTGIATDFAPDRMNAANDIIRYKGAANIAVHLLGIVKGTYTPNPFSYHSGVGFLGSWHDYSYPTVDVYVQFIFNGIVKSQQLITLYQSQGFQANFDLSLNLSFADFFYIKIIPVNPALDHLFNCFNAQASINYALAISGGSKIYLLNRATYDSVAGIPNGDFAYNLEDMTPARIFDKHKDVIGGIMKGLEQFDLTMQTIDKNAALVTTAGGKTIIEKANIPIGTITQTPLFYPYVFSFKTKVPDNFASILSGAANAHIQFEFNGKKFSGFPIHCSVKPALNEAQEWKLLCSPKVQLTDLQDLYIDGLNYINLMGLTTFISHLSPVKFVPLNAVLPAQYHTVHMDSDWFSETVKFWATTRNYYQKWQNNDIVSLQVLTVGLSPVEVDIIDQDCNVKQSITFDNPGDPSVIDKSLFQMDISLADLPEGLYFFVLKSGTGDAVNQFISEPMHIKANWDKTILIEYKNSRNKMTTVFSQGYSPSLRVEGWIDQFMPESKFTTYEDQPADIEIINGIAFRKYKLNIGDYYGLPDWVIDKISRITLLDSVKLDGLGYTRNADSKFEVIAVPGSPLRFWSLEIREAKNNDGITLTTDGTLDSNLSVVYNIRTKIFGNGSGSGGIVQVTEIQ